MINWGGVARLKEGQSIEEHLKRCEFERGTKLGECPLKAKHPQKPDSDNTKYIKKKGLEIS